MKLSEWITKAERYLRSSKAGLEAGELQRLFDRDAPHAFDVVTREHQAAEEPTGGLWRFLYRARILFVGLASKLSPPRRLIFALCIVFALWGMTDLDLDLGNGAGVRVAFLSLLSVAGLVFLLVLELADRVVVRDELEVARELQRGLLPTDPPDLEGYEFAFSYRTANTIGGDYYDFLPLPDGRLALVIGDASGHGIAAGLLMAIANSALKLGFDHQPDPLAATQFVNRALVRTGGPRAFMTLFCAVLEPSSGNLTYACSGHPYPLLRRKDGSIEELGSGALPLGVRDRLEASTGVASMQPGDTLLLYTDGVVETVNTDGESYGYERVVEILKPGGDSRTLHDRLMQSVTAFRGEEPVYDDISVVVVRRVGDD